MVNHVSADFWERDATKHFSMKKVFSVKRGAFNSVNEGFVKDFRISTGKAIQ